MAFSVEDFQDLLRLLDAHPEWQAELRRRLLTDELLEVPALLRQLTARVDALAEAQVRTEQRLEALVQRLEALAQRLDQLTASVDALAQAQERLALAQERLAHAQERTERQLETLVGEIKELTDRVGDHAGKLLEMDYARKYFAFFSRIARRLRAPAGHVLTAMLDDAVDDGRLTMQERDDLIEADIILEGRLRDGREAWLVVEVSWGIGTDDIDRAARRSQILARLGKPAVPVVAGKWFDSLLAPMAASMGVWRVLDGMTIPPEP